MPPDSESACAFMHFLAYLLHHVVEESFIRFAWFIGITTLFLEEGIAFGVLPALVEVSQ